MSRLDGMPAALAQAYRTAAQKQSLRELADGSGLSVATFSRALRNPADMRLSTVVLLWRALGYDVTIYCQNQSRKIYVFEDGKENDEQS